MLDTSASMKATDVSPSRFAVARAQAAALVSRLGEGAETMVIDVDPGTSYEFMGAGNMGMLSGVRSVRADGAGAVVTCLIRLQPDGVSPLVRPFLGRIVRSRLRKDLARLKALLEEGARA